jgi:Ethylbenzene dehydrogenase
MTTLLKATAALLVLGALGSSGCSRPEPPKPTPLKELVAKKVTADLSKPDPNAAYWADVPQGIVTLLAQPMIAPRPEKTTTDNVLVQAVHDGTRIAFRLQWKDPEKSEAGRLGEFSDALALEFPAKDGPLPPVMMGARDMPVHLFHWRAQYQRDKESGKPTVKELYPNVSVDMYPLEFKEAEGGTPAQAEKFSPGQAEGNPQSYAKSGVDEIIAEGFSTSAVQEGHGSAGHGEWKDGMWSLVIVRTLAVQGGSTLKVGTPGHIAFAAWQGGQGEVGSRKCVTMAWTPLTVQ